MLSPQVAKEREDLILSGSYKLLYIMKLLIIDEVIFSTNGLQGIL